jgi:hypothetical protein
MIGYVPILSCMVSVAVGESVEMHRLRTLYDS